MHNPSHFSNPEPECYYSGIGGFNWHKKIRGNEYLRITYYSDHDLPDITVSAELPTIIKPEPIPFAKFDAKHKKAIEQLSNL